MNEEVKRNTGGSLHWSRRSLLGGCGVLLLMLGSWGCTRHIAGVYAGTRATVERTDDFGLLLLEAGFTPEVLPTEAMLTGEQAQRLRMLLWLAMADGNMKSYGPRVTADFLLTEVVTAKAAVPRKVLNERLHRFEGRAVLRPDGYLAGAITGQPLQCVGPVQPQGGALQAGDFKVGPFYTQEGGSFREDQSLPVPAAFPPVAEAPAKPR